MANQLQADTTRFRWFEAASALGLTAPTDLTGGTVPHFVISPFTISKLPTTGILLMLKQSLDATAATFVAAGAAVTAWVRDPNSLRWAAFATVNIPYNQLFVSYDIDASEIYFQIGAASVSFDGAVDIGIAEQ